MIKFSNGDLLKRESKVVKLKLTIYARTNGQELKFKTNINNHNQDHGSKRKRAGWFTKM